MALSGVRYRSTASDGTRAAGRLIKFCAALEGIGPMTILTDLLPDRVYALEPVGDTQAVALMKGRIVGTQRRLEGGGTVTCLGFRPRDDQSGTMGYDERHWFDILQTLGCYAPTGRFADGNDNTEHVSRVTGYFAARFPNGTVSLAPHLRDVEENWPGGFHRDRDADARIVQQLDLPSEALELDDFHVNGHTICYRGNRAVAFRVDESGTLVGFAGHGCERITIDGHETVFADRPMLSVAWAPVPDDRRVEDGAALQVHALGEGELRIPAPQLTTAAVFCEGKTPGSRGERVNAQVKAGRLVFSVMGGGWYYVVSEDQ